MSETQTGLHRLLDGITDFFANQCKGPETPPPTPHADSPRFSAAAQELDALLVELQQQADARREEALAQAALAGRSVSGISARATEEIKRQREADIHQRIRNDVVRMHTTLGTGIAPDTLPELAKFMDEMLFLLDASPAAGVETYLRATVIRKIFKETGPLAWERLRKHMLDAGIDWPDPDPKHRAFALAQAQDTFVNAPAFSVRHLLFGVVPIWRDHYPEADSVLWRGLCIRACGAAIRITMIRDAIHYLRANSSQIKAQGETLLQEQIHILENALAQGVASLRDAERIFSGSAGLLEAVIPDLCWERAQSVL